MTKDAAPSPRQRRSVEKLRAEFDDSFAFARTSPETQGIDVLLIRVRVDRYLLSSRELEGVVAAGKIVPLPSASPNALGLVGLRGALLPVFDLATLLGYEGAAEPVRWLALAGREQPVAFAFRALDGQRRVPAAAITRASAADQGGALVRDLAEIDGQRLPLLGIPSLLAAIQSRVTRVSSPREE
jgi:purine-binding chemotaxis protein CheW